MTQHHPQRVTHPVDLDALENDVSNLLQLDGHNVTPNMIRRAAHLEPLPQQQELHQQVHHDLGKLSADAVLEQYEQAAKAVASMGDEVQTRVRSLKSMLEECDNDMKLLEEAAIAIKEKGKLAHAEIERTSAVSKDIRAVVADVMKKIA
jgi:hypothetical protein